MPTPWFYPTEIVQYAKDDRDISWADDGTGFSTAKFPGGDFLYTQKPLLHIANSLVNDIRMYTNYLHCSEFPFSDLPRTIKGVEVELGMNRGGRITDETVNLLYMDQPWGENRADARLDPIKRYGGRNDMWGIDAIKTGDLKLGFGVLLRFQSHPSWPHNTAPGIDYVRLRFYSTDEWGNQYTTND